MNNNDIVKVAIIGHAVGDALGVLAEFILREKLQKYPIADMIGYGSHNVPKGSWSDDTSMELCTLSSIALTHAHTRSCITCGIYDFVVQELISTPRKSSVQKAFAKAQEYYIDAEENKSYNRLYEPSFVYKYGAKLNSSGKISETLSIKREKKDGE